MKESGDCKNRRTYDLIVIENTVLGGLKSYLEDPALIAGFIDEYNAERRRLAPDLTARRSSIERKLAQARREIDRLIDAIAKGLVEDADVAARRPPLREERKRRGGGNAAECRCAASGYGPALPGTDRQPRVGSDQAPAPG